MNTQMNADVAEVAATEPRIALEAAGIDMAFGGVKALDSASMQLCYGRWTGLIGPNGSGKTTFLNVLSGIYRQSAGTVHLDGEDVSTANAARLAKLGIVRTFQHPQFAENLSIFDNVLLGADLYHRRNPKGLSKLELTERAVHLLEVFGCWDFAEQIPEEAPYGGRKLAEIVRAVLADPLVLLLDEPAAGLSREERAELVTALRTVREENPELAVCLIEHDVRLVASVCEYMQALNFGKVIAAGTSSTVLANDDVKEAYLGKSAGRLQRSENES